MATEIRPQPIHTKQFGDGPRLPAPPVSLDNPESSEKTTSRQLEELSPRIEIDRLVEIAAEQFLRQMGLSPELLSALTPKQKQNHWSAVSEALSQEQSHEFIERVATAANLVEPVGINAARVAFEWHVERFFFPEAQSNAAPSLEGFVQLMGLARPQNPSIVVPPEAETHGRKMAEQDDKVLLKDRVRYQPLAKAAQMAQAPRQTLLNWIKNKTQFNGRPLKSYYFAPADRFFVSEESIQRIANRFVKWPSQEAAGPVTIGETDDRTGFLGMSDAARIIRVSPRTMWLWASQGKAPTDKTLDIIRCTTSDHFYIREKDVYQLKKLIPRSGLQRGRRSQVAPHP